MRNVTLILDDGSRFHGKSFGYEKPVAGEVVFNTAMSGYPESLTDPSYAGQLMTLTYPLAGNYGVPPFTFAPDGLPVFMESERIHAEALIVSDYSGNYSHWNAVESLGNWLKREQVPGITGIDTRELTKVLRDVRDARTDTGAHPNAIIVLGAGVNGSTPSLSMCNRLDAALDYLGANPDALAVVSGGQGEGEDITEAEAMADYLTAHGIDSARIVQEERSRTTRENLENSFAILRARGYDPADGVGIVTSEYHLCRAKRMARALGAEPVGIAAETTLPSMRINYFIREAFAAAYMQLAGTLY